jgi:SAM-dependent methyltransferase
VGAEAIRQLSKDGNVPIAVIEAFGEAIPLESANFDLVVARQVLHHAHDLKQFCFEMARLTRAGGQVITLRDHVISGPEQLQPFLDSHPLHHLYGGENAFTLEQYRTALEQAGLLVVEELRSFRSVVNYDPMSALDIRAAISDRLKGLAGPIGSIFSLALGFLPFTVIAKLAAFLDKRPGRLVSYIARKDAR